MAHHHVTVENNNLLHLAQQLPSYLIYGREENTIKTYMTAFTKWQQWSSSLELATLPANPTSIALCILNQIQMDVKYSSIHTFYYGIKFIHKQNGLSDPTRNILVINMFEAAHRLCMKGVKKKKPITVAHLGLIYENIVENKESGLKGLRTMVICLLGICTLGGSGCNATSYFEMVLFLFL